MAIMQPIVRGIQAVGSVEVLYRYNSADYKLKVPKGLYKIYTNDGADIGVPEIPTDGGVSAAGFRLDSEFLRANPQIASSAVIPILGGGAVALTNNNRSGSLVMQCSKVSTPDGGAQADDGIANIYNGGGSSIGALIQADDGTLTASTKDNQPVYDLVTLAQIQQATVGGDSVGSSLCVRFVFAEKVTMLVFEGCTVAEVAPIILAGNDAPTYQITWNYLTWGAAFNVLDNKKAFSLVDL